MKTTWTESDRMEKGRAVKASADMDRGLFMEELGDTAA